MSRGKRISACDIREDIIIISSVEGDGEWW